MRHEVRQARQASAVYALTSGNGADGPGLMLVAMLGVVLVSLDASVVNVALNAFRRASAVRPDGLQWGMNVTATVQIRIGLGDARSRG